MNSDAILSKSVSCAGSVKVNNNKRDLVTEVERDTEFQKNHNGIIYKNGLNAKSKILVRQNTQKKIFKKLATNDWLM